MKKYLVLLAFFVVLFSVVNASSNSGYSENKSASYSGNNLKSNNGTSLLNAAEVGSGKLLQENIVDPPAKKPSRLKRCLLWIRKVFKDLNDPNKWYPECPAPAVAVKG